MARIHPLVIATAGLIAAAIGALAVTQQGEGGGAHAHLAPGPAGQRQSIQRFIESGADVCSLDAGELLVRPILPYVTLEALVNDVDAVVLGTAAEHNVLPPEQRAIMSQILTTLQVDDVLAGSIPAGPITVDYGAVVHGYTEHAPVRATAYGLDPCAPGPVLLFLEQTGDGEIYRVGYQGWARIDGNIVRPAVGNRVFESDLNAQQLLDAIRQIADDQQAQGLPKGLLLCQSMRTSDRFLDPVVCPGETFNPYHAFRFDAPIRDAFIIPTDPGPSPLSLTRFDLRPDGAQLRNVLATLDVEVVLEPEDTPPDDLISLDILPVEPVGSREQFLLEYSPSTGIIRLPSSSGQFDAPPAFLAAMQPFLARP